MSKYLKLFNNATERKDYEANSYIEPYVSLTLEHTSYEGTIGKLQVNVTDNGDGTFTVTSEEMPTVTTSSFNSIIAETSAMQGVEYVELPSDAATDGQNAQFVIDGTTYYGEWYMDASYEGWDLFTTQDYSGYVGRALRLVITEKQNDRLLHYNKTVMLSLTLDDESEVDIKAYPDETDYSVTGEMVYPYSERLVEAEIVNGVTTIYYGTFSGCTLLTSVDIPNSVTTIGEGAFDSCASLTSITIPASVTILGEYAFFNCENIESITFEDINKITLIDNGDYVFGDCHKLESIGITADTPWTFMPYRGFMRCYALKSIVIPDTVTNIMGMALCRCTSLTEITIPSGVTEIGMQAFDGCTGLTKITCLATTPPALHGTDVFANTNGCTIYVPAESVATYKAATYWKSFKNRIQAIQN